MSDKIWKDRNKYMFPTRFSFEFDVCGATLSVYDELSPYLCIYFNVFVYWIAFNLLIFMCLKLFVRCFMGRFVI